MSPPAMPEGSHGGRPNVLVIMADQLRRDALGVYGDRNVETPNIDRLAAEGVTFTSACVTSPICVPYRFTFMTGEYAHSRLVPGIEWRMSPAERTLADELREAGYQGVYVGKWHLYGGHGGAPWSSPRLVNRTPVPREHQGRWEVWRGFELRNDPFDTCYFVDDDPTPRPLEGFQTDGLAHLTIETLRRNRDESRPFFCVLSVEPPHPPYLVPPEDQLRWLDREVELPANFAVDDPDAREVVLRERRLYYAAIENLDRNVGKLLDFLEDEDLAKDTVVVFLADHGELGGSHGLREKQYPFEESIGVPLIVRDPRLPSRAGARVDEVTCSEDLFPTLLAMVDVHPRPGRAGSAHARADAAGRDHRGAGLSDSYHPRPGLPGRDLSPLVRGEVEELGRDGILLEFVAELRRGMPFYEGGWRGYRTRRYKYTWRIEGQSGHPWQLFDLQRDPHEQRNLVGEPATEQVQQRLHELMAARMRETGDSAVALLERMDVETR